MAGRLSLSIAINLLTENFKKGTNTVKNGFRSMHAQVLTLAAALGFAGVSLSNLVSEMIRIARETGKAVTALKNVSGSTAQFAENLRFTTNLAKKYGAYVNDITGNFAKFTAAASIAGMTMDDQRKLFESLSRASAAFGLSADETNGMFLAVTQMMGKGKIQAEELRGQLGERLPIAMQAMAKAAGTTVAGLDDIMKKGQLLSADVLPGFADALNEMIPNVDTDNLETSLNRLKNTFQEITNSAGVQGKYKALIDGLTGLLQGLAANVNNVFIGIVAAIVFVIGRGLTQLYGSIRTTQEGILRNHERCQAQALAATERKLLAEQNLERAKANYIKATEAELLTAKIEMKKAEIALKAATTRETKALAAAEAAATKATLLKSQGLFASTKNFIITGAKQIGNALRAAWASFGFAAIISAVATLIGKFIEARREAERIRHIFKDYKDESVSIGKPEDADKLQRLYKIVSDTNAAEKVRRAALTEINSLLGTSYNLNKKNLQIDGDINAKVAERIKLLKDAAAIEFYQRKKLDAESEANEIIGKYGSVENLNKAAQVSANAGKTFSGQVGKLFNFGGINNAYEDAVKVNQLKQIYIDADKQLEFFEKAVLSKKPTNDEKSKDLKKAEEAYIKSTTELANKLSNRVLTEKEYERELAKLNKATYETLGGLLTPEKAAKNKIFQSAKKGMPQSKTHEAENSYWDELNKYANQFALNLLTEKEYAQAKLDLTQKTLKEFAGLDELDAAGEIFVQALLESAKKLEKEILVIPKYKERDTTFDYKKNNLEKMQADRDSRQAHVDRLKGVIGSDADEIEEKLKAARGNLEALKKEYNALAPELIEALNDALGGVTTLDEALKIAEVKKDVKDLTKQLNEGMYSGIKNIVSGADRLVSSFSKLGEVMNDENATAWERFMAVWEALTNTADAILGVIETIKNLSELSKQLAEAKAQEQELDSKKAETSLANAAATQAEAAANAELAASIELLKNAKGEASSADDAQTQKEITNNATKLASDKTTVLAGVTLDKVAETSKVKTATTEVTANTAAAASNSAKSASKIPFPFNLIAMAGAIAATLAVFAALPKFAAGGIVHGKTSGDLNVARVNGGEMILNGRQQATLFQIANGGGVGREIHVVGETYVAGDKLRIVLENNAKKQRRGR